MLDVLCAIAIVGIISTVVWHSLSVGYSTSETAKFYSIAAISGSSKLAEIELGIDKATSGIIDPPYLAGLLEWQVVGSESIQCLEVSWSSGQIRRTYKLETAVKH